MPQHCFSNSGDGSVHNSTDKDAGSEGEDQLRHVADVGGFGDDDGAYDAEDEANSCHLHDRGKEADEQEGQPPAIEVQPPTLPCDTHPEGGTKMETRTDEEGQQPDQLSNIFSKDTLPRNTFLVSLNPSPDNENRLAHLVGTHPVLRRPGRNP